MASILMGSVTICHGVYSFLVSVVQAAHLYLSDEQKHRKKEKNPRGIGLSPNEPLPEKLPTAVEIKKVIPSVCFQPTVATSMYYAVLDFVLIALTYIAIIYLQEVPNTLFRVVTMLIYWGVQGTLFTAIFVIGHDCGHDSFSRHPVFNDVIGTIWHAFLLVPYYMWKLSHRHHHKNTANIDQDEVFYPVRESETGADGKVLPGFGLGTGWFGYLILGYRPRVVRHFNPYNPMFKNHFFGCVMSLIAWSVMAYLLAVYTWHHGFFALFCYYGVPLFIFGSYAVIITFLHHNEMNIPWYGGEKWDFVRGQLSSIDRHYGIVHHVIHSIGTHQMHHMFSKIPHYHLEEATVHFRKAFPDLVRVCDEPIMTSFFRMFKKWEAQGVIKDDKTVHYYE